MQKSLPFLLFFLIVGVLAGCAGLSRESYPTLLPEEYLPTVVALTVQTHRGTVTVTPEPGAASSITITPTVSPPSRTPTFTGPSPVSPTPTPEQAATMTEPPVATTTPTEEIPLADIEIQSPGPLSRVTSPIVVQARLFPGAGGLVKVELLGEDGRLLTRSLLRMNTNLGRKVGLYTELEFDTPAMAELGRLQISIDDKFHRTTALSSVDLILLSSGESDLNVPADYLTRIYIEEPKAGALIQGGSVIISGLARPLTSQPLVAELISPAGKIVGMRLVAVSDGPEEIHRPFAVEVAYQITEPTWVRLVVRERGIPGRIPGTIYLSSLEVLLSP